MPIGYGSTLTVRRQLRDPDGDLSGPPVDTTYDGWRIAPVTSTELAQLGRDVTTDRLQAFGGPDDVDIVPGDRIYLDADDRTKPPPWQVIGHPEQWAGVGWSAGRVVTIERTRG
jgi:hypothetical protein